MAARLVASALLLGAGRSATAEPAEAMAFIRVLGDETAEFIGVWRQPVVQENVEFSTGSGFVIAPSGLVLTNHHVVDDAPEVRRIGRYEAAVRLENRRIEVAVGPEGALGVYEAWVVASDPELDLAVLQVTAAELPYVPFGDSDAAEAGVSTSPEGDFTVVLRALRWGRGTILPAEVARSCDATAGAEDSSYGGRFERLGVPIGVWGTFVEGPGGVLLLELEAPEDKLPFLRDLYLEWRERVAG